MARRIGLRKISCLIGILILLTACADSSSNVTSSQAFQSSSTQSEDIGKVETDASSESSDAESSSQQPQKEMPRPQFEVKTFSQSGAILKLKNLPESFDKLSVYRLYTDSDNAGKVTVQRLADISADDITNGAIEISFDEILETTSYEKNDIAVRCPYRAQALRISYTVGNEEISSDIMLTDAQLDTGTVDQNRASLAGSTACGAAAGTLILQSAAPLWGDELTARMDTVRSYCALSDEFSIGGAEYYMSGQQISNSVNKYIKDNKLGDLHLTDHRSEKSTEQTLLELISTGRPAVLEVCYIGGNIITDYQGYSHWITVNGSRMTENGIEFRCEDTITLRQRWITSADLDAANKNVRYGGGFTPTRYISSFDEPITDSFM